MAQARPPGRVLQARPPRSSALVDPPGRATPGPPSFPLLVQLMQLLDLLGPPALDAAAPLSRGALLSPLSLLIGNIALFRLIPS